MSASCYWAIMGVLFMLQEGEVEAVETRKHPHVIRARRHGIGTFLFTSEAFSNKLIIGTEIGSLGPEGQPYIALSIPSLTDQHSHIEARLRDAGFTEDVRIHLVFDQD